MNTEQVERCKLCGANDFKDGKCKYCGTSNVKKGAGKIKAYHISRENKIRIMERIVKDIIKDAHIVDHYGMFDICKPTPKLVTTTRGFFRKKTNVTTVIHQERIIILDIDGRICDRGWGFGITVKALYSEWNKAAEQIALKLADYIDTEVVRV